MSKVAKSIVCIECTSVLFLGGCSNSTSDKNKQTNNWDKTIVSSEDSNIKEGDSDKRENESTSKENVSNNDNEDASTKEFYLKKLNSLEADINSVLKEKYDSGVTVQMVEAASEEYGMWDKMLNEVYSKLKEQLSETNMSKLTEEELNWIKTRDEKSQAADDGFEDGSMAPLLRIESSVKSTKERCYELVNNYME